MLKDYTEGSKSDSTSDVCLTTGDDIKIEIAIDLILQQFYILHSFLRENASSIDLGGLSTFITEFEKEWKTNISELRDGYTSNTDAQDGFTKYDNLRNKHIEIVKKALGENANLFESRVKAE